jgi:hypothetical protein
MKTEEWRIAVRMRRSRIVKVQVRIGSAEMQKVSGGAAKASMSSQTLVAFLILFAGLFSILVLIVTVSEAWKEHAQQSWPTASATVNYCNVDPAALRRSRMSWHIACGIHYLAESEETQARLRSRGTTSANEIAAMQRYVQAHRKGSSIEIHYDPANHSNAVLTSLEMPGAGPRSASNVRLLMVVVFAFLVLLTIGKTLQSRNAQTQFNPPVPPGL